MALQFNMKVKCLLDSKMFEWLFCNITFSKKQTNKQKPLLTFYTSTLNIILNIVTIVACVSSRNVLFITYVLLFIVIGIVTLNVWSPLSEGDAFCLSCYSILCYYNL